KTQLAGDLRLRRRHALALDALGDQAQDTLLGFAEDGRHVSSITTNRQPVKRSAPPPAAPAPAGPPAPSAGAPTRGRRGSGGNGPGPAARAAARRSTPCPPACPGCHHRGRRCRSPPRPAPRPPPP